jgi:hypothetical protein
VNCRYIAFDCHSLAGGEVAGDKVRTYMVQKNLRIDL